MATSKKNTVQYLIASKIQGYLLSTVKEEHTILKDYVEQYNNNKNTVKSAANTYESTKIQVDRAMQRISILETVLHKQNTQLGLINYLRDKSKIELQRCIDVLYDAKYAVACALQINDTGKDFLEMGDKELMCYLLNVLRKGDSEKWKNKTPSLMTVSSPEETYKIGDLGFEPSHIESPYHRRQSLRKKSSKLSTLKILGALGVKLSRLNVSKSQIEPQEMDITDVGENFVDSSIYEKADEMSLELSLSLESQEEELGLKTILNTVEEEERETDEEEENERETKIEIEEKLEEEEIENQDDHGDDNMEMLEKNEKSGSEISEEK